MNTRRLRSIVRSLAIGAIWGSIGAFVGSLALGLILTVGLAINLMGSRDRPLGQALVSTVIFVIFTTLLGFMFAAIPGSIGGMTIAGVLNVLVKRIALTRRIAIFIGALVGVLSGICTILIARIFVLESSIIDPLTIIISGIAGGVAGRTLMPTTSYPTRG